MEGLKIDKHLGGGDLFSRGIPLRGFTRNCIVNRVHKITKAFYITRFKIILIAQWFPAWTLFMHFILSGRINTLTAKIEIASFL